MVKVPSTRATCSSGCYTKDHKSYSECLKSKSVGHPPTLLSTPQKRWDAELNAYSDAVRQGIQPAGTSMNKIQDAVEISQRTGRAFDASNVMESIGG